MHLPIDDYNPTVDQMVQFAEWELNRAQNWAAKPKDKISIYYAQLHTQQAVEWMFRAHKKTLNPALISGRIELPARFNYFAKHAWNQ